MNRNKLIPFGLTVLVAALLLLLAACVRPVDQPIPTPTPETPVEVVPEELPTLPPPPTAVPDYPGPGEPTTPEQPPAEQPGDQGQPVEGGETPPSEEPPVAEQPRPSTHTVQAGETLFGIAQMYGLTAEELAIANNLANVNQLDVGQVLTIPAEGVVVVPPTDPGQPSPGDQVHIVQRGENLFRIGLRYGFTVNELAAFNGIANPEFIYVGQVIRIPPR